MTARSLSLRTRLALLILTPLVVISVIAGVWRYDAARGTAEDLFDRTLLASALAISRDVAISGGDALSEVTRDLMRDASGGAVFYHVYAPDGVFITGYATPPVPPLGLDIPDNTPVFYRARYLGQDVRVVRLREYAEIEGISGIATITAWQNVEARNSFARELAVKAAGLMLVLIATVGAVVWFGINLGLKPLTDLRAAISKRTPDDLGLIKREVPKELKGIVATLNGLLGQISDEMESKDAFISNAAHQLRNPVAGVLSMAEAVQSAPSAADAKERTNDLVEAARHTSRLATQMLSFERAKSGANDIGGETVDLNSLVKAVADRNAPRILKREIALEFIPCPAPVMIRCDPVLLSEAIENLIDNALVHGGDALSAIRITVTQADTDACITVHDDGSGIAPKDRDSVFERFAQANPGTGSGLGLSIVEVVSRNMGGRAMIDDVPKGASLTIRIPQAANTPTQPSPIAESGDEMAHKMSQRLHPTT